MIFFKPTFLNKMKKINVMISNLVYLKYRLNKFNKIPNSLY